MSGRVDLIFVKNCYPMLHGERANKKDMVKLLRDLRSHRYYVDCGPKGPTQSGGANQYDFLCLTNECAQDLEIEPGKTLVDFHEEHGIEMCYPKAQCIVLLNRQTHGIEVFAVDRRICYKKIE